MQRAVERILAGLTVTVEWGICIRRDGTVAAAVDADRVLPTASMGKALLLLEVARRLDEGTLDPAERLSAEQADEVGDSGLWQHLAEPTLSVASLAVLVGAVSDNLATNVLLRRVGLDAVDRVAQQCGLADTRLLDRIRDDRGPGDPPAPSVGTAAELSLLMQAVAERTALNAAASTRVASWLSAGVDTSMVAGGLALDPLAHGTGDVRLLHKTGWDAGVRADAGHVRGPAGELSYAVLARWDDEGSAAVEVPEAMRRIGGLLRQQVVGA